jgi:predicted membrane protein
MIGGIIAILIALWFYRTAESRHLSGIQWAIGGAIAFYIPNFIWSLMVAKPMMNQLHAQNATGMVSMLGFSSVFVGAIVAILVHFLILRRTQATAQN